MKKKVLSKLLSLMLIASFLLPTFWTNEVFATESSNQIATSREFQGENQKGKKLSKFEKAQYSVEGILGEQKELELKGFAEDGSEIDLDLEVEIPDGWKPYIDVTTKGNKLTIKDKGKAWNSQCIVNDKSNKAVTVRIYIEFKEPVSEDPNVGTLAEWDFDKANNTLKGFKNKDNPTEVVIPKIIDGVAVKHIGKDAFKYSTIGSSGKVKNRITKLTIPEGIESIGEMSFQKNNLTELKLPSTLKKLERGFYGNENLKKVEFAEGINLEAIGAGAFYDTGLESIELPTSVKRIEADAFKGTNIKKIELSDNIIEIGDQAFGCTLVEEFNIPKNIAKLGKNAGSGIFFRTFSKKTAPSKGTERFTKIYDSTGKANVLNTRAIVNPQPVTIKCQNEKGLSISEDRTLVGYEKNKPYIIPGKPYKEKFSSTDGDKHYYTDYMNPFQENTSIYVWDRVCSAIIGENYYTLGNSYEFVPEYIKGYITPDKVTKTITKDDHEIIFTYKEAEKVEVKTEGEGLSLDIEGDKESLGKTVTYTVYEPSGKVLDKLLLNGADIKPEAKFDGLKYSGSFEIKGKTLLKAIYKDEDVENKLQLEVEKTNLKLGETSNFTVKYRGKEIKLPNEDIEITTDVDKLLKINEDKGTLKGITAKAGKIKFDVKSNPSLKAEKSIKVEAVMVNMRMEDIHNTVISKSSVEIDKLYLTKGVDYYTDVEFDAPTPALAIEKALKAKGVNTALKEEFDCGDNLGWMKILGKNLWTGINENGSFMYAVDNKMADKVISSYELKGGENICVFYDDNWQARTDLAYFEEEEYKIEEGEEVEFTLMGVDISYGADKTPKPISSAVLEFIKGSNSPNVSENKTDEHGKIKHKFDKAGEYLISAVATGKSITRPYAKVIVKEKTPTLKDIKDKLVKELESYKNLDDYREAEKGLLKQEVKKGTEAINAASDEEKAKKALADAKAEIDKIKTASQLDKEEAENKAKELKFADTSDDNKNSQIKYDFSGNKVSFVVGQAKDFVLKLDVDFSNMFKDKKAVKENLVGSLNIEEDGKVTKELEFGKDYTAKEGSIVVTVNGNYLNGLKVGKYKLKLQTLAGFSAIDVNVMEKIDNQGNQSHVNHDKPINSGKDDKVSKAEQAKVADKQAAIGKSAKTGDCTDVNTPLISGGVCLLILMILISVRRKRSE